MLSTPMPLSRRSRICICCCALLIVPGCSRSALTSDQTAALTAAKERWKQSAVRDYAFEIRPFAP